MKECSEKNLTQVASSAIHRKVFTEEYNLGFHRPRKDQCWVCMAYNCPQSNKASMETEYRAHIAAKDRAREEKRLSKQFAENSKNSCNMFFLYRAIRIVFNFTIYYTVSKQGDCFIWREVEGKRGSCEIAGCLYKYFESLPKLVNQVQCFSDRCDGRNLYKYLSGMCLTAVQRIPNLESTELMFLVSGHSEMVRYSMHSAIFTGFKRVLKAHLPQDWKDNKLLDVRAKR
nr:unnamed protein product [Callosobruchus chinensis]